MFFAEARYLEDHVPVLEPTVGVTVLHEVLRQHAIQAGYPRQQRSRRGIHVHTHRIHAVFDRRIERSRQGTLIDIVLVLAHAD